MVLNSGLLGQDKNISFCKAKLVAEKKLCDVKFLGVYLSTSKELVNIKWIARSIVGTFVHILGKKRVTASQLSYINNQVLLPKLEYILQTATFSEKELDFIHQPLIRLYKRRLELAQTAPNDLLFHRGVLDFKSLASTLITKQATSVLKRVNSCKTVGILAEIRIKQGAIKAGILKDMRST